MDVGDTGDDPAIEDLIKWVEVEIMGGRPFTRQIRCAVRKGKPKDFRYHGSDSSTLLNKGGSDLQGDALLEWVGKNTGDDSWFTKKSGEKLKIKKKERAHALYLHCVPDLVVIDWDAGREGMPPLWKEKLPYTTSCSAKGKHFYVIVKDLPEGCPAVERARSMRRLRPLTGWVQAGRSSHRAR